MEKELAIITGADGGMGQEITKEIARAGYPIIMACKNAQKATPICEQIKKETGNTLIEIREINLASLTSVNSFTEQLLKIVVLPITILTTKLPELLMIP